MTDGGYIVITRRIFEHPLLQDADYFRAWVWLISEAAWKPRRVRTTNGRASEIIEIGRGQLTHSRRYMSGAWRWSEKRVRTFLNRLKLDGMIETQTGPLQTVITICNYDVYQIPIYGEGRQTGQKRAGKGPAKGRKKKNLKKERIDIPLPRQRITRSIGRKTVLVAGMRSTLGRKIEAPQKGRLPKPRHGVRSLSMNCWPPRAVLLKARATRTRISLSTRRLG